MSARAIVQARLRAHEWRHAAVRRPLVTGHALRRAAVALVWLYHGLWCKLLAAAPDHAAIVAQASGSSGRGGVALLWAIGLVEVALAAWVLIGRRLHAAAVAQTALLVLMNAGGLLLAPELIRDPGGMLVANLALLALIWTLPGEKEAAR